MGSILVHKYKWNLLRHVWLSCIIQFVFKTALWNTLQTWFHLVFSMISSGLTHKHKTEQKWTFKTFSWLWITLLITSGWVVATTIKNNPQKSWTFLISFVYFRSDVHYDRAPISTGRRTIGLRTIKRRLIGRRTIGLHTIKRSLIGSHSIRCRYQLGAAQLGSTIVTL